MHLRPNLTHMTTGGGSTRWEARLKRFRTIALAAPIVLIVALHAFLLLRRVGDASITRPVVLGQWAFAAVLLAAASQRRHPSATHLFAETVQSIQVVWHSMVVQVSCDHRT